MRGALWVLGVFLPACSPSAPAPPSAGSPATANVQASAGEGAAGGAPSAAPAPLADRVGACVEATGYASGAKIGPQLVIGADRLWIAPKGGAEAWASLPSGGRVRVRGIVRERNDLPVMIRKPDEPIAQGIYVPEGTDVEAARRRLVIEDAEVSLLATVADVEASLTKAVGSPVALAGTIWSRNGRWWFNHDGVDLHLENRDAIADSGSLHGAAITLRGKLARKPMPRLDQMLLKPQPDLADAFVLAIDASSPHPGWPIEACPARG